MRQRKKRLKRYLNPEEGAFAYNSIAKAKQAYEKLEIMGVLDTMRKDPNNEVFLQLHRIIKGINNALHVWGNDRHIMFNPNIEPRL